MKIAIIIPTYKEEANVQEMIINITYAMSYAQMENYELIFVDDNSPDKTREIIQTFIDQGHSIKLINRVGKQRGYGESCKGGMQYALSMLYDPIITMDCDMSHDPKVLPEMINKINSADLVIGSRYVQNGDTPDWPSYRKLYSKGANTLCRLLLRFPVKDCTSGFRCYSKEFLSKINLDNIQSNGYSFLEELLYYCVKNNAMITEIPIIFKDRTKGHSKLSKKEITKFFVTMIKLCFKKERFK